jgi:CBS domain-containing protein
MSERTVRAIIEGKKPFSLPPTTTVSKAAQLMKRSKAGAVMVVDHGRLVGVFTERDALLRVIAEGRDPHTTHLDEVMTPDPQTIHPDKPFFHALVQMHEHGFRHLPVVEGGTPIGIVSSNDALNPELETFVSDLSAREHIREIL